MKIKELINELEKFDRELEVGFFEKSSYSNFKIDSFEYVVEVEPEIKEFFKINLKY